MSLFGTIIVGFEDDGRADGALGLSSALARATGDEVDLVLARPVRPMSARVRGGEFEDLSRPEALGRLDRAGNRLKGVRLRQLRSAPAGAPVEALRSAALQDDAGLIVVSAPPNARGGIAERLLRDAPCAVAVARPWIGSHPRLGRVSVALDGSEPASAALAYATALARLPGSPVEELELLSFGSGPAPAWLTEAAEAAGARARRSAEDPLEGLVARSRCIDLLIVGTRDSGPLRRLASGSVAAGAVRAAECPVMVVPRGVRAPTGTA